jgi:outer membrane protein OmpA-like peptidoglycan-associated protein
MRILIAGTVLFVIWAFFSAWLYNDVLLPVINKPVTVQTIMVPPDPVADLLAKIHASAPKPLIIYFEFDKEKFKADPQTDSRVADYKSWLDKYPKAILSVTGHTDLVGTIDYNFDLAFQRAQIVLKYLEGQGINPDRIRTESKGESEPVFDYITAEGRAKNRRTEISIKMQ